MNGSEKIPARLSRRRMLAITGVAAGLPFLPGGSAAAVPVFRWQGIALGAPAQLVIAHPDRARAAAIVRGCLAEVARLERVFSLFQRDSELCRLNQAGQIDRPSLDLLRVLDISQKFGALTGGAFDVTIQPLWLTYRDHFARYPGSPAGPGGGALEAALRRVDYRAIEADHRRVAFARDGMSATLNGLAQGYITDRVADLLRDQGLDRVLVQMGETRALGRHPAGRPWRIAGAEPQSGQPGETALAIDNRAVASSGGYGTRFEPSGRHHHLFDPATGTSARQVAAVTVVAERAVVADAVSTALAVLPPDRHAPLLNQAGPIEAVVVGADGARHRLAAPGE